MAFYPSFTVGDLVLAAPTVLLVGGIAALVGAGVGAPLGAIGGLVLDTRGASRRPTRSAGCSAQPHCSPCRCSSHAAPWWHLSPSSTL